MTGILAIAYGVWSVSAEREVTKDFLLFPDYDTHR